MHKAFDEDPVVLRHKLVAQRQQPRQSEADSGQRMMHPRARGMLSGCMRCM